ncbi:hypothetical protein B0T17DRAFT_510807 [Bombardia bombarda]|uniref:Rhodopsin domain-containing protein n=1 Tax=Bombardia bombarda TaxID=252184 RepID=A0AA40BVB0_9PEZI|nr:hypothetical protein B0T17DRAFT_510807 [Bombardia bombarda]
MTLVPDLTYQGKRNFAACISCLVVVSFAVALRFWCKVSSKLGLHLDDWWILAALIFNYAGSVGALWGLLGGIDGKEIPHVLAEFSTYSPSTQERLGHGIENFLESIWLGYFFGITCLYTAKISVLLMYRRIFSIPKFQKVCLVFMILTTAWYLMSALPMFFVCTHIEGFWRRLRPGTVCHLDFNLYSSSTGMVEVILDAAILTLPIRALHSLSMKTKTRCFVSCMFLVGGLAVVTNIPRIYYQYQPHHIVSEYNIIILWLLIHVATTVICACLPVYGPLRIRASTLLMRMHGRYSARSAGKTSTTLSSSAAAGPGSPPPPENRPWFDLEMSDLESRMPIDHKQGKIVLAPSMGMHTAGARHSFGEDDSEDSNKGITLQNHGPRGISMTRTTRVEVQVVGGEARRGAAQRHA